MIAANNSWVIAYDNLSGLSAQMGDALCSLSTGGGLAKRELYTDRDEILLDAQRPIILNGIDEISRRGDVLDRSISITLRRITDEDRISEKVIKEEIDRILPGVLGAFLDIVAHGLKEAPNVRLDSKPRMADFVEWVVACEGAEAIPWEPGAFLDAYYANRRDVNLSNVEEDLFAASVVELARYIDWTIEDTAANILSVLISRAHVDVSHPPRGWPLSPKGASNKLRRIAPALRSCGVEVEFLPRTANARLIRITGPPKDLTSQSSLVDGWLSDEA